MAVYEVKWRREEKKNGQTRGPESREGDGRLMLLISLLPLFFPEKVDICDPRVETICSCWRSNTEIW